MAEREQFKELRDVLVFPGSDAGHQGVIHEREFCVSKRIPAPVHRLGGKRGKDREAVRYFIAVLTPSILEVARKMNGSLFFCVIVDGEVWSEKETSGTKEKPRFVFFTRPRSSVTPSAVVGSPVDTTVKRQKQGPELITAQCQLVLNRTRHLF